jgi:copper transport protein
MRFRARIGFAVAAVAAIVPIFAGNAGAHALLRASTPSEGQQLQKAPDQVVLTFTEAPEKALSVIQVLDSRGAAVTTDKAEPVAGDPMKLALALPSLAKGVYTVSWRTVSRVDGHVTAGAYAFGVGVRPGAGAVGSAGVVGGSPRPSVLSVVARWAFYWGLALLLALGVMHRFIFRPWEPQAPAVLVAAALGVAGGSMLLLSERSVAQVGMSDLLGSTSGRVLAGQLFLVLAAGCTAFLITRAVRYAAGATIVLAAGAMLVHAYGSHARANRAWMNVPIQWAHIVAVGVWIGGLIWLFLAVKRTKTDDVRGWVHRFSTVAGVALVVVVVTGTMRALDEVGARWRDVFQSGFGISLAIKIVLVAVLIGLGAWNRYRTVPTFGRGGSGTGLARTVTAEIALAAVIFAITGALSQLPPPIDIASAGTTSSAGVVAEGHDFATSVRVGLSVDPGAVGENSYSAKVVDYDTGAPVPARRVSLRFALPSKPDVGGSGLDLSEGPPGVWTGTGSQLSIAGTWHVTVLVQEKADAVTIPLNVNVAAPEQHMTISKIPGQPTLYTIDLTTGGTLQTYIQPGNAGINNVHFTFFAADGSEAAARSAEAFAVDPSGKKRPLKLIRFTDGHFVSNIKLIAGDWTFGISAVSKGGAALSGHFDQEIGP